MKSENDGKSQGRDRDGEFCALTRNFRSAKKQFSASVLDHGLCLQRVRCVQGIVLKFHKQHSEEGLKGGGRRNCGMIVKKDQRELGGQLNNFSLLHFAGSHRDVPQRPAFQRTTVRSVFD